jgi:hypothetical protein
MVDLKPSKCSSGGHWLAVGVIHLDDLSLAFIGNVAAGGCRDEAVCGSPDIFDKET